MVFWFGSRAGSGYVIPRNGSADLDPYQNETDPQYSIKLILKYGNY